jgi:hypothetical protein
MRLSERALADVEDVADEGFGFFVGGAVDAQQNGEGMIDFEGAGIVGAGVDYI